MSLFIQEGIKFKYSLSLPIFHPFISNKSMQNENLLMLNNYYKTSRFGKSSISMFSSTGITTERCTYAQLQSYCIFASKLPFRFMVDLSDEPFFTLGVWTFRKSQNHVC